MLSLRSCPSLCDPMDYSPPASSVHGILQARLLKGFQDRRVVMPFSREIFPAQRGNLRLLQLLHCRQILYPLSHLGRCRFCKGRTFCLLCSLFCLHCLGLCCPIEIRCNYIRNFKFISSHIKIQ